jgi:hypothetical protein
VFLFCLFHPITIWIHLRISYILLLWEDGHNLCFIGAWIRKRKVEYLQMHGILFMDAWLCFSYFPYFLTRFILYLSFPFYFWISDPLFFRLWFYSWHAFCIHQCKWAALHLLFASQEVYVYCAPGTKLNHTLMAWSIDKRKKKEKLLCWKKHRALKNDQLINKWADILVDGFFRWLAENTYFFVDAYKLHGIFYVCNTIAVFLKLI